MSAAAGEYTVQLERVFSGPLDLLLHLVREQEVEIHEVEIHRILDGYVAYLERLQPLDLELAGDFLVLAATLMAIKSRSLLPGEEVDVEAALDPRDELIRRLIEYRRFKQAAGRLEQRAEARARLLERGFEGEVRQHETVPLVDWSELSPYDLLAAWSRLLRETNAKRPHLVLLDQRPLRYYVERLVARLRESPRVELGDAVETFGDAPRREALVGSFCALLELVRLGLASVDQAEPRGAITIRLQADVAGLEDVIRAANLLDEAQPDGPLAQAPRAADGGAPSVAASSATRGAPEPDGEPDPTTSTSHSDEP
jgi:segregation and condensation protein A